MTCFELDMITRASWKEKHLCQPVQRCLKISNIQRTVPYPQMNLKIISIWRIRHLIPSSCQKNHKRQIIEFSASTSIEQITCFSPFAK